MLLKQLQPHHSHHTPSSSPGSAVAPGVRPPPGLRLPELRRLLQAPLLGGRSDGPAEAECPNGSDAEPSGDASDHAGADEIHLAAEEVEVGTTTLPRPKALQPSFRQKEYWNILEYKLARFKRMAVDIVNKSGRHAWADLSVVHCFAGTPWVDRSRLGRPLHCRGHNCL